MKNYKFKIFFILLFSGFYCLAQEPFEGMNAMELSRLSTLEAGGKYYVFDNRYEGIKGSTYYLEDWAPGKFKLENGKAYELNRIKYNVYEGIIAFVTDRDLAYTIAASKVEELILKEADVNKKFIRVKLATDEKPLMLELVSGFISIYEHPKITFKEANYQGAFPSGNPYDEFIKSSKYYIKKQNRELMKVNLNKKFAKKYLNSKDWSKVEDYVQENDLDLKDIEDWVQLFEYYNSM